MQKLTQERLKEISKLLTSDEHYELICKKQSCDRCIYTKLNFSCIQAGIYKDA